MSKSLLLPCLQIPHLLLLPPIFSILSYLISHTSPLPPTTPTLYLLTTSVLAFIWALLSLALHRHHRFIPLYFAVLNSIFFLLLLVAVILTRGYIRCGAEETAAWEVEVSWEQMEAMRVCRLLKAAWGLGVVEVVVWAGSAAGCGVRWWRGEGEGWESSGVGEFAEEKSWDGRWRAESRSRGW